MEINEAFDKKTEIWGKEDKSRLVGLFTLDFCMAFFQTKKKKKQAYLLGHLNSNFD